MVVFVCVCLKVADFFMMFACWDSVEPIRCDVGDVYVGCGIGLLQVVLVFGS